LAATKLALRVLGERCAALDTEVARLDAELDRLTAQAAPRLRQLCGVGPEIAGALLVAAGDNPGRLRSEAAFSMLCGASPIPASSGKTVRYRLNRGGNRQATPPYTRSWSCGCAGINQPATTWSGGPEKACPSGRSSAA
jgi:transposase